jgi:hypothetical protein
MRLKKAVTGLLLIVFTAGPPHTVTAQIYDGDGIPRDRMEFWGEPLPFSESPEYFQMILLEAQFFQASLEFRVGILRC